MAVIDYRALGAKSNQRVVITVCLNDYDAPIISMMTTTKGQLEKVISAINSVDKNDELILKISNDCSLSAVLKEIRRIIE